MGFGSAPPAFDFVLAQAAGFVAAFVALIVLSSVGVPPGVGYGVAACVLVVVGVGLFVLLRRRRRSKKRRRR